MGVTKTLWEILDHQRQEPAILDSRDAGTSHHFDKARPFRWKVGVRGALVLVAGVLVVVVGANFMRSLAPVPEPLPVAQSSESPSVAQLENSVVVHVVGAVAAPGVGEENTYGHPTRGALEILEASGTTPLQSDERGIVTVSSTASGKLTIWSER